MKLTDAPDKIVLPFADAGGKNVIPVPSQIGITPGAASYTDGFPPLTRTEKVAGGLPPDGLDMNGVLYYMSAIDRWANSGASFVYDSTFATDIGGYPQGATLLRSDGDGFWLNTIDDNTSDPDAGGAGWVPAFTQGVTAVTMTGSNVTLTAPEYGRPIIIISGALSANLNLIFPAIEKQWTVINNTTGSYTITCKTASGTGIALSTSDIIYGDGTNIYSALPSPKPLLFSRTFNIGSGGDYATFNLSLLDLTKKYYIPFKSPAIRITLNAVAGYVMAEQIIADGIDLSGYTITGTDAETVVTRSSLSISLSGAYPLFGAVNGGSLPIIDQLFNMDTSGTSTNRFGIYITNAGSNGNVLTGAGVKNVGWVGASVAYGGKLNAYSGIFSGCGTGLFSGSGGEILADSADVSGCATAATGDGRISMKSATATGASSYGIRMYGGGEANVWSADFSGAPSSSGIVVVGGSIIRAAGATGSVSQTVNVITTNGLIIQ